MRNCANSPVCSSVAIANHVIIGSNAFQPYGRAGLVIIGEAHRTIVRRGYAFQQMVPGGRSVIIKIQIITISILNSGNKIAEILLIRRHVPL
ncbi:hypothetical protein D9M70_467540 [compost metagenome]